jgi:hypothetical protein
VTLRGSTGPAFRRVRPKEVASNRSSGTTTSRHSPATVVTGPGTRRPSSSRTCRGSTGTRARRRARGRRAHRPPPGRGPAAGIARRRSRRCSRARGSRRTPGSGAR